MAIYETKYLNQDEGVVPLTDILVSNRVILVVDVNQIQILGAVHKVVFSDKEGQTVDRGDIEDVGEGLVILIVVGSHLSDVRTKI